MLLFLLRIDTLQPLSGGFGLRAINATNASTIENIAVAGFPDGQLLVDATPHQDPGPNFFRIARFSLSGGIHPLQSSSDGRQNLLIEQATINLGATSEAGAYLRGGEQLAVTRVVESVSVTGTYNVPGFWIDSTTPHTFVGSSRTASGALLTSPGFLYVTVKGPTTTPRPVAECLHCSVSGLQTALAMPALGISVAAPNGPTFDQLQSSQCAAAKRFGHPSTSTSQLPSAALSSATR